jgi:hypothetical protein
LVKLPEIRYLFGINGMLFKAMDRYIFVYQFWTHTQRISINVSYKFYNQFIINQLQNLLFIIYYLSFILELILTLSKGFTLSHAFLQNHKSIRETTAGIPDELMEPFKLFRKTKMCKSLVTR